MDGTVDPAPAQQGGVGGVDDSVDVLLGDVALDQSDLHTKQRSQPGSSVAAVHSGKESRWSADAGNGDNGGITDVAGVTQETVTGQETPETAMRHAQQQASGGN
ncbi:hypothetical protein GCM10022402_07970 [Salinactinospora qingdaonensis]|uniref:MT0933-like antitoxin protein n=1 Tax=Salinactinospora qingdaonensis TaxID=702744 RepID=A0ABP7F1R4_9ACTN